MASCGTWSLLYALEMTLPGYPAKLLMARWNTSASSSPPDMARHGDGISGKRWITRRRLAYLSIMPLVTVTGLDQRPSPLVLDLNPPGATGPFWLLATTKGPAFWCHTAYSYALIVAGSYFLLEYLRTWQLYRQQARGLLLGVLAPWCGNVIFLTGISPFGRVDLTPLAFLVTGLALAWSVFGHHLLDLAPIARDAVFTNLSDPVFVIDAERRVVDLNPAAERLLGRPGLRSSAGHRRFAGRLDLVERFGQSLSAEAEIKLRLRKANASSTYVSRHSQAMAARPAAGSSPCAISQTAIMSKNRCGWRWRRSAS